MHVAVGGGICLFSVKNMAAAVCFVWLIETLSHPSMSRIGSKLASYLNLVIILERVFVIFVVYRFKFG